MRNYKWVCLLFFGLVLFINIGCKEDGDGKLLSGLSGDVDSSTGGSGCRGRNSGVKSATLSPIYLPFANGTQHVLGQGWFGTFSHDTTGREHALDFSMVDGVTDIYAVKSGIVMAVKEDSNTTCSSNCPYANYVEIDHGSGFYARYLHFAYNSINVNVGDVINSSTYILGKAGNTGWSTGPHLHIEVVDFEENCTAEYTFNDVGSAGNLNTGTAYTSGYNTPGSAPILSQL